MKGVIRLRRLGFDALERADDSQLDGLYGARVPLRHGSDRAERRVLLE